MGLKIFVKDGIFWPSQWGLYEGDTVDIVLVGGGNKMSNATSSSNGTPGGLPGEDSMFGSYVTARAGYGAKGAYASENSSNINLLGGGGGYVPGNAIQGGDGQKSPNKDIVISMVGSTNGGGVGPYETVGCIIAGTGSCFGGGKYPGWNAYGGNGYGAGGGAVAGKNSYSYTTYAGNAGEIVYASHVITKEDVENGIPVTIGMGNTGMYRNRLSLVTKDGVDHANVPKMVAGAELLPLSDKQFSKNVGMVILDQLMDGTYTIQGEYINGSDIGARRGIKFKGVDAVFDFSTVMKGLPQNNFLYECGDYYVSFTSGASVNVYWVLKEAARRGVAPKTGEYGSITYEGVASRYNMAGFVDNCLVITACSSNTMFVYENWTPNSTSYKTVTLTKTIPDYGHMYPYRYLALIPYSDKGVIPVGSYYCSKDPLSSDIGVYITNVHTGDCVNKSYSTQILGYIAGTSYVCACWEYYQGSAFYPIGYDDIYTDKYRNGNPDSNLYFRTPGGKIIYLYSRQQAYPNSTKTYLFAVWPTKDDGLAYSKYNSQDGYGMPYAIDAKWDTLFDIPGYNNKAADDDGGGAGGCCMITW